MEAGTGSPGTPEAATTPRKFKLSDLVPLSGREVIYPPFEELTMLIYGAQGTGKTSFFGNSGIAMILSCEPGAKFQTAPMREIGRFSYDETRQDKRLDFCTMVAGIVEAHNEGVLRERGVEIIVIDTVDRLHQLATQDICERNNVASIGDIPYGKGYSMALDVVKREVRKLQAIIPVGLISHAITTTEELENEFGVKKEVEKIKPSVDRRVGEWLAGEQNIVGYTYKSVDGKYLIKFHTDPRLETKDRTSLLEGYRKPIPTRWDDVVAVYNKQAEAKGITLRSKWAAF